MERGKYFEIMRETSEIVDPIIVESVAYLKEINDELHTFIINIPAFKKRVEKKDKLRPFLLRLSYELAGGKHWEKIASACAAVEIFNISTYVDNAFFDNKNNIKEKDKVNYVISARILRNIAEKTLRKISKKKSEILMELLREIDHDGYLAQFEDMNQMTRKREFRDTNNYLKAYLHRCEGLTGRFMENITKIGAILAGATENQIKDLGKIGRNIGIIDQIINDVGDFVPPEEKIIDYEKVYQDQFNDIKSGKLTLPVYHVLQSGLNNHKEIINKVFGNKKASNGDLNNVAKVLVKGGAIQYSKKVAREYYLEIKGLLNNFEKSNARNLFKIMSKLHQTNKYIAAFRSFSKKLEEKQENIILVDKDDKEVGFGEKIDVHKKGKLHRAFSILVFNSKNQLLIQQRAKHKYHSPTLWANTVCSHPKFGEKIESAVHRRLKEELGFDCSLDEISKFHYIMGFKNGLTENEIDHVFIGKFDGEPAPNPEEVMDYKWISIEELKKDINENPENYSYWIKIILERFENKLRNCKEVEEK